eukprot:6179036-Pleurochrysis_carterae.AAC.2
MEAQSGALTSSARTIAWIFRLSILLLVLLCWRELARRLRCGSARGARSPPQRRGRPISTVRHVRKERRLDALQRGK